MVLTIRAIKLKWLGVNIFMVFCMIAIGGITRLTDSGLSMTDWRLLDGMIPPLNYDDWLKAFNSYKEFPEYKIKNYDMSLIEFKKIFFWEYLHRIWGRLIGLTFFLPMIFIWIKKGFNKNEKIYLVYLSLLGFFQAFMGWYMVKSGLLEKPDVSHFRLSAHLITAFIIYSMLFYFFWNVFSQNKKNVKYFTTSQLTVHKNNFQISVILLFLTICAGAFVSGTDAGMSYNNFPLMDENILPPILLYDRFPDIKILFNDQGFLQFLHRLIATITLLFILHSTFKAYRDNFFYNMKTLFFSILFLIVLQYSLGVVILKLYVPKSLGLLHQIGSLLVLTLLVITLSEVKKKRAINRPLI